MKRNEKRKNDICYHSSSSPSSKYAICSPHSMIGLPILYFILYKVCFFLKNSNTLPYVLSHCEHKNLYYNTKKHIYGLHGFFTYLR